MPAPIKTVTDFELINSESPEGEPWLAATPDGRFNLTFFESFPTAAPAYTDIETRLYSAAGLDTGLGPAPTFSATTTDHQGATAYFPDGRNVYVWTEEPNGGGGNLEDVYASIYVGQLVIVPRFLVAGGAGIQHDPVVAASASGFVVALADDSVASGQLILKFYNAAGGLITTVTDADGAEGVNTAPGTEDDYRDVEITVLSNGNYVVTWTDDANFDIWARIYSPTGVAQTGLIEIEPGGSQATFPDVTALADGRFLVTYEQFNINTVRGRIYEANGTSSVGPFTITTDAANAVNQQVQSAALDDGRFVTVWRNIAGNIEGQVMFADGTADGAAFAINADAAGSKGRPTIATLADGRFAVSWESGAGATATIFTTIFDPREAGLSTSASSFNDDWFGTGFADLIFLGEGNDRLPAGAGNDTVSGEEGNDTIFGEAGADSLAGGDGNDQLSGAADNDTLAGGFGNDLLDGGAGVDAMTGGGGNDTYIVDATGDTVLETDAVVATGGYDIVTSSANFTLSDNVEQLVLVGGATIGIGGSTPNYLYGGNSGLSLNLDGGGGDDVIYAGLAGGNTLVGGSGVDTLLIYGGNNQANGGLGSDIYYTYTATDVLSESGGDGIDTVFANWNFTMGAGFEQLILFGSASTAVGSVDNNIIYGNGTSGAVNLFGLDGADVLFGGAFNDTLNGGNGVDLLFGLGGTNTLVGGDDTDVYYVETAGNIITETLTGGFDTMYSNFAGVTTLAANVEQLILYGNATGGTGTGGNDYIYANSAALAVTLDGGGGSDYLLGSAQNDTLIGGLGNDQFELVSGGLDRVRYNTSGNMGADTVYNFNAVGNDLIDLTGQGYNAGAIGGAITVVTFAGGTLVTFTAGTLSGTTINLVGVAVGNVTAADFAF